jgi:hypothetical protein
MLDSTVRRVKVGGVGTLSRHTLREDIETTSIADVRAFMKSIIAQDTAEQINLDNPPVRFTIDGRDGKKLDDIKYRASVLFGTQLSAMAMRAAEYELSAAIKKWTTAHTGALSDVSGSWKWYLRKGSATKGSLEEVDESSSPPLGPNEYLILLPDSVPYATVVEKVLWKSAKVKMKINTKKGRVEAKMGYMEWAARKIARLGLYKDFNVANGVSKRYKVANNYSPNVVYLIVWAKRKR